MREGRTFQTEAGHRPPAQSSLDELRRQRPELEARRNLARWLFRSRGPVDQYGLGAWAWMLNRVTGLVLVAYAVLHVVTLGVAPSFYGTRAFKWLAVVVVAAAAFHGFNGLRLLAADLGILRAPRAHDVLIRLQLAGTVVALGAGVARALI